MGCRVCARGQEAQGEGNRPQEGRPLGNMLGALEAGHEGPVLPRRMYSSGKVEGW